VRSVGGEVYDGKSKIRKVGTKRVFLFSADADGEGEWWDRATEGGKAKVLEKERRGPLRIKIERTDRSGEKPRNVGCKWKKGMTLKANDREPWSIG